MPDAPSPAAPGPDTGPGPTANAPSGPAVAPVPRRLCDVQALAADPPEKAGAMWSLGESGRQLDANVVHLPPGGSVGVHTERDLDVLLLVVAGDGTLGTTGEPEPLTAGALMWLPSGSTRSLDAGPDGLSYVTVHRRRPGMRIRSHRERDAAPLPE